MVLHDSVSPSGLCARRSNRALLIALIKFSVSAAAACAPIWGSAAEFLAGDSPSPAVIKNAPVSPADTLAGYSIFTADGDWRIFALNLGKSGGTARPVTMAYLSLYKAIAGKIVMTQDITASAGSSEASGGWLGDPCAGQTFLKINRPRGNLDRCATARLSVVNANGRSSNVLQISIVESNLNSRYYAVTLTVAYEDLGLSQQALTDPSSPYRGQLSAWMANMLDATVTAAGYSKPQDAFRGIPPLLSVLGVDFSTRPAAIARAEGPVPTTVPSPAAAPAAAPAPPRRPLALRWDSYGALITGTVTLSESGNRATISAALPRGDGSCTGAYELGSGNRSTWAISCTNGMAAAGTIDQSGRGGGATGSGIDAKGTRVELVVGEGP